MDAIEFVGEKSESVVNLEGYDGILKRLYPVSVTSASLLATHTVRALFSLKIQCSGLQCRQGVIPLNVNFCTLLQLRIGIGVLFGV